VRFAALLEGAEETAEGVVGWLLVLDVSEIEDVGGSFGSSGFSGHELLLKVELGVISLRLGCIEWSTERFDLPRGS
jgi:hypothetical protein